ncbi:MAG: tyrosine--tRNA ligase [Pseudomonadales bacterium]|nr:tyrosine--tRNA ligase [Pseudomonadales bacterium]
MQQSFLENMIEQGLTAQISDPGKLGAHLASGMRTLYCGFDPTADSLHIGNLVPLLGLRRFQLAGHRPIVLVGGATGLIGDPSFKADERSLNDRDVVAEWAEKIKLQVSPFVSFGSDSNAAIVVNNLDWTKDMDVIGFLRDIGKHFSVNAMMQKESVRSRLNTADQGLSFTEFSYMVLQSMDYMELARRYECTLQIGGSDQWGNITSGMDLVRRTLAKEAYALTLPLVTKADGTKFGKTELGTIWLDAKKTSPYAYYQFWLNTADADVSHYLRIFTFLLAEQMAELDKATVANPERRDAQRMLAEQQTQLVHGNSGLESAQRISKALFGGGSSGELTESDLAQLQLDGMDTVNIEKTDLASVLADSPLAQSKSAARRLVTSGGVKINGVVAASADVELSKSSALYGKYHIIQRGKKHWCLAICSAL